MFDALIYAMHNNSTVTLCVLVLNRLNGTNQNQINENDMLNSRILCDFFGIRGQSLVRIPALFSFYGQYLSSYKVRLIKACATITLHLIINNNYI